MTERRYTKTFRVTTTTAFATSAARSSSSKTSRSKSSRKPSPSASTSNCKATAWSCTACARTAANAASRQPGPRWGIVVTADVRGKRVLVTGAASGIGRSFAETLAAGGAAGLGLIDVSEEGLAAVAGSLGTHAVSGATPPEVATRVADVSDGPAVTAVIDELAERLGGLDWAIHCAAILGPGTFAEQPPEEFERVVRVNLIGTANVARACFPHLRTTSGAIACIASTAAVHGWPEMSAYSASKFGVSGFCDAIRQEFAREGVRVTAVYPLLIDTPMLGGADRAPILKQGKAIPPSAVVRRTLAGLARGAPRVFVPGQVRVIAAAHGLAPSLLDAYGRRFGLRR
ncbi:MAG: SDR family NAD(P)-dependent oxidoreductase [Deltaproteobacteria bacterium]|nr:MAG: SDR family NAD(P)-dependent oxidoreductase [Deltaproteobacteria bacterium]